MKTILEIEEMLAFELFDNIDCIKNNFQQLEYYNELLGDSSFILAHLLDAHLKERKEWKEDRWIDDSLITKLEFNNEKLSIFGVMIWGKLNTTEQWIDPFNFLIDFSNNQFNFNKYILLFCDLNFSEITYSSFKFNSNYWGGNNINWKYKICPGAHSTNPL